MIGNDFQHEIKQAEYEIRMLKCAHNVRARMGYSLKTISVPSCRKCRIRINYADNSTPAYTFMAASGYSTESLARYRYTLTDPSSTQDCYIYNDSVVPAFTVTIYSTRKINSLALVSYDSDP